MTTSATIMIEKVFITPEQITKGLMNDFQPLRPGYGALFVFPQVQHVSIWMKDTPCALDILFIKEDMTICNVQKHALPFDTTRIPSIEKVNYVVETLSGYCDTFGIKVGQKVTFHNAGSQW
jgi:uncharacterized membrane protein (UPF0127 family)